MELAALVVLQAPAEPPVNHVSEAVAVHSSVLEDSSPAALIHPTFPAESNPGYWALSTPKSSVIFLLSDTFPWH